MIEALKRIDLAGFMNQFWGTAFEREGESFVALSPFRHESQPSFYVNQSADGHWVYFDHGRGQGGTIIDAMMAYDGHSDVALAIRTIQDLLQTADKWPHEFGESVSKGVAPDLEGLLQKLLANDIGPVRDYLGSRSISNDVVDLLVSKRMVVLNRLHESNYCCFVVRDANGQLRSLFNRKIDGPALRDRFLLGEQYPFCSDWTGLSAASGIHICESIIDAISLMTLHPDAHVIGLPGANFDVRGLDFLPLNAVLVEAFDTDEAGRAAANALRRHFPQQTVKSFDLQHAHDVSDLLCCDVRPELERPGRLSLENRIRIVMSNDSSRKLALQYGVHHSRICKLRKDATEVLEGVWSKRRPGRKPSIRTSEEVGKLHTDAANMKREYELSRMRIDWLELQVEMWKKRATEAAREGRVRKKKARQRRRG